MENTEPLNILIAEDSTFNQLVIERIMQELNNNYTIVENGQLAIDKSIINKYDLILMDIEMPVLNGSDATKLIKSDVNNMNHSTPVIGFTSHISPAKQKEFLELGMEDIISKPFNRESIKVVCDKYLTRKQSKTSQKNNTFNENKIIEYNLSYLEEFTGGDKTFIKEMLSYFVVNTPMVLQNMENAINQSNWEELKFLAHKYSSEISFVGVQSIAKNLDDIENYSFENINIAEIKDLFKNVSDECHQVTDKIKIDYNL